MKRLVLALIGLAALLAGAADARTLQASVRVERQGGTVNYEVRLEQPSNDQLIVNVWRLGQTARRADGLDRRSLPIDPSEPGVYRFSLPASGGDWRYYARVGPGQAGYVGNGELLMPQSDGTVSTGWSLYNSFEDSVPDYVQPVGYAVFFAIAALALGGTAFVLRQLARRNSATA